LQSAVKLAERENRKEQVPFNHYLGIYKTLDPVEIAGRCGLAFNGAGFALRLLGTEYLAAFPDFELRGFLDNTASESMAEKILILRYLCEGKFFAYRGKQLSYPEVPWGEVYYQNFQGRCTRRFAGTFGQDLARFKGIMEKLGAESLGKGDASYRFEFINGLYMSLLLWAGDEEFSPQAQILFDDNFVFAFTAEDIAVVGEVVIARLKAMKGA
jgi:hypothetical protein